MHATNRLTTKLLALLVMFIQDGAFTAELFAGGTQLRTTHGRSQLFVDGSPFLVRGVGGDADWDLLRELGGNAVRTWSTEDLEDVLQRAANAGLKVTVGFWIGHERHGFDYQDDASVRKQLESCLETVKRFKDHPAVLLWAIGNEAEGDGSNPAIWYAINHIARECKRIDPDHPTMTVIAELGSTETGTSKVAAINRYCPDVDIVGINSYGGIVSVAERYRAAGGTRPYLITEFGPLGPWEVGKTAWGSPVEETSTEKAARYATGYKAAVTDEPDLCLGSHAFLWGTKQETTATWFGMLLPDGTRLAACDAMSRSWGTHPVRNQCPKVESLTVSRAANLRPGEQIVASLNVRDPEDDPLSFEWRLLADTGTIGAGGDFQEAEREFQDLVVENGSTCKITAPDGGGGYRIFAYVRDNHGGGAVANVPLYVDAPVKPRSAQRATLPFVVYRDGVVEETFAPSGYMGNTTAITQTLDAADQPHSGPTCLKVTYADRDGWGGVLWQSPPNDWDGQLPGGKNFSGAAYLEFWARGARGGEVVNFLVGGTGDQPYADTSRSELPNVRLTDSWTRYVINLRGKDVSRIKTGFGWSAAASGTPVTFYLDDIRYVAE